MLITELSEALLLAVKKGENTRDLENQLAQFPFPDLKRELADDPQKKAFWINCYNAYFLILRKHKRVEKPAIFRQKLISIAGKEFSLDDMEHGILRKYRWKWSLGYLPNLRASPLIKNLAVKKLDYRIHFALNCGAKSCPPIAFYYPQRVDQQLDLATTSFLEGESKIDEEAKQIQVTSLFQWYQGDFGGTFGVKKILKKYLAINPTGFKITYADYNWQEQLDHFKTY